MNLITKLAYNALTKTIQAIAPGGQSIVLPGSYQEGSWTPGIFDAATAGVEATYSDRGGNFVKIGKLVIIHGWMNVSSVAGMTGGNAVFLRNLPFAAKNATGNYDAPIPAYAEFTTFSGFLAWVPGANTTRCTLKSIISGAGSTTITVTNLGTGYTTINGSYITEE